jgi:hypothetical protein
VGGFIGLLHCRVQRPTCLAGAVLSVFYDPDSATATSWPTAQPDGLLAHDVACSHFIPGFWKKLILLLLLLLFIAKSKTAFQPTQSPIQWVRKTFAWRWRRPEREANGLLPYTPAIKRFWNLSSRHPCNLTVLKRNYNSGFYVLLYSIVSQLVLRHNWNLRVSTKLPIAHIIFTAAVTPCSLLLYILSG